MHRSLVLAAFFITGASGLVYEVTWTRMLVLVFGSTQLAVTTVLATFMGGLALGSWLIGRRADELPRPLMAFGAIEVVLGLYCVLTPWLWPLVRRLYYASVSVESLSSPWVSALQLGLTAIVLVVPSTLMGGTLPLLVKHSVHRSRQVGSRAGSLYAVNTLGAVAGCVLAGFFLVRALGLDATLRLAGLIDVLVGAVVLALGRRVAAPARDQAKRAKRRSRTRPKVSSGDGQGAPDERRAARPPGVIFLAFGLSGFVALALEVLWFRVFSLVIGVSTYAFTTMLATFLAGIGLGSLLATRLLRNTTDAWRLFALLQIAIGSTTLFGISIIQHLPYWFRLLFEAYADRYWLFVLIQAGLCAALILIPTLCMGAVFPTVAHIARKRLANIASDVGRLYATNSAGAILGSLAAGLLLGRWLGTQVSIMALACGSIAVGCYLWLRAPGPQKRRELVAGALGLTLLQLWLSPSWDRWLMTTGPYVNPSDLAKWDAWKKGDRPSEVVFYREGHNAVISVHRGGRTTSYRANGKSEAIVTHDGTYSRAWQVIGHLPLLLAPAGAERAVLVGLGAGITLGAMTRHPLTSIAVVELEPAVLEAARFFVAANDNAIEDPRVRYFFADGRAFMAAAQAKSDVIVSAVSDPWISGVSNLFSTEYFGQVASRLSPGGVATIWLQNYRISDDDFRILLRTATQAFPYVSLWNDGSGVSDLFLVAGNEPLQIDPIALAERIADPALAGALRPMGIRSAFDVLAMFLAGDADLRSFVGDGPVNSELLPILEYSLPQMQYAPLTRQGGQRVNDLLAHASELTPPLIHIEEQRADVLAGIGHAYSMLRPRHAQARKLFRQALELEPDHAAARRGLASLPP